MDDFQIECITTSVIEKLSKYPLTKMVKQDVLTKTYQLINETLKEWR